MEKPIKEINEEEEEEEKEEEEPTRCCLVFYYTYERLNMFGAALCPSSGANHQQPKNQAVHVVIRDIVVSS
jgi:hypothetical protein